MTTEQARKRLIQEGFLSYGCLYAIGFIVALKGVQGAYYDYRNSWQTKIIYFTKIP